MELVYLWVEDYKNIQKQGFNFSPNFDVKFTPIYEDKILSEKSELKITPKVNHLKDFFGKDINVTAIVGENGSGKSSILELLDEIFRIEFNKNRNLIVDNNHTFDFSLVFKIKDKTYKIKLINKHDTNTFNNDEKIEIFLDYYVYSNDREIKNQFLFENTSIAQMLVYDYSQNKNFKLSSFMYLPIKIEIRLCDFGKKFEKLIQNDKLYPPYKNESDNVYIQNTSEEQQTQIESFENINDDKYFQFLILKLLENNEETHSFHLTKKEIKEKLITQKIEFVSENDFNLYFNISNEPFNRFEKEVNNLIKKEKEIYIDKFSDFFEFDFIDEQNRRYSDLSHGEKTLFGQLLNIYYNSIKSENNNLLFLFDEPELSLHPQWQKNYINEIYNLVKKLGKNYHFIFTSHSPFLLSDLPKENIIFLEKGKQVYPFKDGKQTFGANIHTLLSHGFFMKDGLMGEFAKDKIQSVINFLNDKEINLNKEKAWAIIQLIGEPFLKFKLEEQFYEKFSTNEEKRQAKIKELEEELQRLKNVKP